MAFDAYLSSVHYYDNRCCVGYSIKYLDGYCKLKASIHYYRKCMLQNFPGWKRNSCFEHLKLIRKWNPANALPGSGRSIKENIFVCDRVPSLFVFLRAYTCAQSLYKKWRRLKKSKLSEHLAQLILLYQSNTVLSCYVADA